MKYKHIGKIKEPHGLKGDVYILVFSKDISWASELKSLQIKSPQGEISELEVLSKKPFKAGLIVKLKQIQDRNQSEAIKGYQVLIPENLLTSEEGETIFLSEILGFEVFLNEQCVGIVDSFSSNGPQDILVIRNEEHVFEVPFVKEFTKDIDFESKRLIMDFPKGLMSLDEE